MRARLKHKTGGSKNFEHTDGGGRASVTLGWSLGKGIPKEREQDKRREIFLLFIMNQ